jgi:ribosomal protein S18 acetylase RimI-like enzyme
MLDGAYGEFLNTASLAFLDPAGLPVAQIACSIFDGEATILFVYTGVANQRKGLAKRLIRASAAELEKLGFLRVSLFVTDANPAKELYEKLGFKIQNEN